MDLELTDEVNEIQLKTYNTKSVSKLLTSLDGNNLFERLSITVPVDESGPVAQYRILEQPFPTEKAPEDLEPADVPEFIADVLIFDATEERPSQVQITGVEGEGFEQADKILNEAVSDMLALDEDAENEPLGVVPRELEDLEWNCHFPADFPATVARQIETKKMQEVSDSIWPNLKLSALGGRSPNEVVGDESAETALNASVYVLDAFYDRNNVMLDIDAVRLNLKLNSPPLIEAEDDKATGFSTINLQRIDYPALSDSQLVNIARRVLLVRHTRTAYQVLREVIGREECLKRLGPERVYSTLVGICREQNRRDEAFDWLAKGRAAAADGANSFRSILEWDVKELNLRMDDPTDAAIPDLWSKFEEQYLPKLPELAESLTEFMREKGLGHLVSELATAPGSDDDTVWSDDEPAETGKGGKLWLPGQD